MSLDGLFRLKRVKHSPPPPPTPPLFLAEFRWASVNCSGDKGIIIRVWEAEAE